MAQTKGEDGNTAMPNGPRDRVAMLSLNSDGTIRDTNPEIIGDREAVTEAAREQFAQQAVSAIDRDVRVANGLAGVDVETVTQDPAIVAVKAAHDEADASARSAAEATVDALYTEDVTQQGAVPAGEPDVSSDGKNDTSKSTKSATSK